MINWCHKNIWMIPCKNPWKIVRQTYFKNLFVFRDWFVCTCQTFLCYFLCIFVVCLICQEQVIFFLHLFPGIWPKHSFPFQSKAVVFKSVSLFVCVCACDCACGCVYVHGYVCVCTSVLKFWMYVRLLNSVTSEALWNFLLKYLATSLFASLPRSETGIFYTLFKGHKWKGRREYNFCSSGTNQRGEQGRREKQKQNVSSQFLSFIKHTFCPQGEAVY